MSASAKITIKANEDLDVAKFGTFGSFINLPESDESALDIKSFRPAAFMPSAPATMRVDPQSRTETYKFLFRSKVKNIIFETKFGNEAHSIIVTFVSKLKTVWHRHYILPDVS